jgi:hypothetical protein
MVERMISAFQQGTTDPLLPRGNDAPQSPENRVAALQRDLAAAQAQYTDKHPEIQRLRDELAFARREAAEARENPSADPTSLLEANPTYRQLMVDRETGRMRLRALQRATDDAQRQIAVYQARVEAAPMVEQQLASVQRIELESSTPSCPRLLDDLETSAQSAAIVRRTLAWYPPTRVRAVARHARRSRGIVWAASTGLIPRSPVHDVRDLKDEFDLPVFRRITRIRTS